MKPDSVAAAKLLDRMHDAAAGSEKDFLRGRFSSPAVEHALLAACIVHSNCEEAARGEAYFAFLSLSSCVVSLLLFENSAIVCVCVRRLPR